MGNICSRTFLVASNHFQCTDKTQHHGFFVIFRIQPLSPGLYFSPSATSSTDTNEYRLKLHAMTSYRSTKAQLLPSQHHRVKPPHGITPPPRCHCLRTFWLPCIVALLGGSGTWAEVEAQYLQQIHPASVAPGLYFSPRAVSKAPATKEYCLNSIPWPANPTPSCKASAAASKAQLP